MSTECEITNIVMFNYSRNLEFYFYGNQFASTKNFKRHIMISFLQLYYHYHFIKTKR